MKKLFSAFLAVVLVLSTLCLPAVASVETATFGTVPEGYAPAEDSVGITSFEGITDAKGKYHLTADVTVEVAADLTEALYNGTFSGIFDGAGHKIVFVYTGDARIAQSASAGVLFKLLKNATVKNLTVEDAKVKITGSGSQNGVLANRIQGTVNLENIAVSGTEYEINADANKNIGGYVGDVQGNVNMKDCSFEGVIREVSAAKCNAVGAFFGIIRKGASFVVNMENCHTLAGTEISGTNGAAGLVGEVNDAQLYVNNCTSAAKLEPVNYAGGAIYNVAAKGVASVKNFVNNSNLQAKHAGGVIGRSNGGNAKITVANAINNGTVVGGNDGGTAGGVMGTVTGAATVTVTNFHNNGTAIGFEKSTEETAVGAFVAAGIGQVNQANAKVTVSNLTNSGEIGGDYTRAQGLMVGAVTAGSVSVANGFSFATDLDAIGDGADAATVVNCRTIAAVEYAGPKTLDDSFATANVGLRLNGLADSGVRYEFALDTNLLNAFAAAGYDIELGSLYVKDEDVKGAFTVEQLSLNDIVYSDLIGSVEKHITAEDTFAAALVNLSAANYATDFACAGYVNMIKDGEIYTFYTAYDANAVTNLKAVATEALADEANAEYADILNVFAAD